MQFLGNVFFLLLLLLVPTRQVHAYLDPGSGSFLFQLLVGAVLSGLFAVKVFFRNIKTFIAKALKRKTNSADNKSTGDVQTKTD